MNEYEELILDKIKFGIMQNLNPIGLKYSQETDILTGRISQMLSYHLLGKRIETKRYPSTWKDALKERFIPKCLQRIGEVDKYSIAFWDRLSRRLFKVQYNEFNIYNICPHLDIDFKKNKDIHIEFLKGESH